MCPQTAPGRGKEWTRKMPLDLFEKILDQLPGTPIINLEGSGEPTMAKDLPRYIQACTERGLKSYIYTNGLKLQGQFMKDCVDAGLSAVRFSIIGYSDWKYKIWMNSDEYHTIWDNIRELKRYAFFTDNECDVSTYHLITNNENINFEMVEYTKKIRKEGVTGYIWKMHNWSGNYKPGYERNKTERRTCGRPFAPEVTIRSGGHPGHNGAVTSCCQTLGPPNETKSVMGHLDDQTLDEVWNGDRYKTLRKAHAEKDFDSLDFCKDCDFLYDDPEVLVWTNDPNMKVGQMLGTNLNLLTPKEI